RGNPLEAIAAINGKIWKKLIDKSESGAYIAKYKVISTKLHAGRQQINVYSENMPGDGFTGKDANLEDVYFTTIPADEMIEGV
ncbi:MAG: hypothetical protein RAO94_05755, partial [Candidatus Stygibacter australis]|nr:hypothetical protein [Candidatus Stygibacter australis]